MVESVSITIVAQLSVTCVLAKPITILIPEHDIRKVSGEASSKSWLPPSSRPHNHLDMRANTAVSNLGAAISSHFLHLFLFLGPFLITT